ncbi:DUF3108 domain-containing protein [Tepidimonas sp. HKU77]|uniref:DUF3108 domain-containing protein n=1 Tax=Tepidimonas sp. HKU77 TaxID=3414503 RepID=UPI003C7B0D30
MKVGVLLAPRLRIAAAVAGVVALHAAALALLWPPASPAGRGPDGARAAVVAAALLAPSARPAPLESKPQSKPPAPRPPDARPRTPPAAAQTPPQPRDDGLPSRTANTSPALAEPPSTPAEAPGVAEAPGAVPQPPEALTVAEAAPLRPASPGNTVAAWQPPPSAQLHYDVLGEARGLNYRAQATLDWQRDGERYRAELTLRAFLVGTRTQSSVGTLSHQGLQPLRFEDRARRTRGLTFEWAASGAMASALSDDGARLDGLPAGTQDRLSVFIQLGPWVDGAQPGERWSLPVVGSNQVETWTFEVVEHERLALPAGEFDTLRLRRSATGTAERGLGVELWFSPALPGLPVRLVLQQANGDRVDQQLRAWRHTASP